MIDLFLQQMSINEHRNWWGGPDLLLWLPSPSTKLAQHDCSWTQNKAEEGENNAPTIAL